MSRQVAHPAPTPVLSTIGGGSPAQQVDVGSHRQQTRLRSERGLLGSIPKAKEKSLWFRRPR
jgi:hypothetical protein